MSPRRLLTLPIVIALICAVAQNINASATISRTATMNIQFVHYTQLGIAEQDVFVEPYNWLDDLPSDFIYPLRAHDVNDYIPALLEPRSILAPHVVRVEPRDAQSPSYLAKSLFASETVIPHDPEKFGPNPLGPFWKGDELGFTLRQWLAAQGSGVYVLNGKNAELTLAFQKLVPQAQYVLQCIREPANAEFDGVETDCPHWSSLRSRIQTDADGNASLRLQIPALPESNRETTTVLQLVYTRGAGDWDGYGWNEHVQLVFEVFTPHA